MLLFNGRGFHVRFHIRMTGSTADTGMIEQKLHEADPAGLVDMDPTGQLLRVAASIDVATLASLMEQAGFPVSPHQIEIMPSECCGGCGG